MEGFDDYLNLNDILACSVRVPCKLKCSLRNLGSVIPANEEPDIPANTLMDMPLWLVKDLTRREGILELECPKYYKKTYREIQIADPRVLNLHKMGPNFYFVGLKFSTFKTPDSREILATLYLVCLIFIQVLRLRLKSILDHSQSTQDSEDKSYVIILDDTERYLYKLFNDQNRVFLEWQHKPKSEIKTSINVQKMRKRKQFMADNSILD
ncbi:DNA replication complex GINS protein PSF3 [Thelohanellus kitauei]|uniref:DNA replication complex GINS protein PSF3 n=1 Tax=Thelohanellus kitauei TaxID=669202 RepID=A0A0C2IZG5_THEKT|nr:DNA replication complex GINS protein PSF3 [Thelohanellus kitauei]